MRLMRCELQEASVRRGEFAKPLGRGLVVDLDEVVGHEADGTPVILEQLLDGDPGLLHAFVPVETDAAAAPQEDVEPHE